MNVNRREFLGMSMALAALSGCKSPFGERRWYKGLFHCHSLWSDGRAFPEQVVDWYRSHGYNFLGVSDHNQFQDDPAMWAAVDGKKGWRHVTCEIFDRYRAAFPDAETRTGEDGVTQARLRTYRELCQRFDVPGAFAMLPATELTHNTVAADGVKHDVHMNLVNVPGVPAPYLAPDFKPGFKGRSVESIISEKCALSAAFAKEHGRSHLFVLNHPIWRWYDVGPEALIANPQVRFFEVCNNGAVDAPWPGLPQDGLDTDRLWDVVNAFRAKRGQPFLYGVGNDDTHYYFGEDKPMLMPGNAWSRVRARSLDAEDLVFAMTQGDFMACEGIEAEDVDFDRERGELSVAVAGEPGESRKVTFVVSKRGFDEKSVRTLELMSAKPERKRRVNIYDDRIGKVAKVVVGKPGEPIRASYRLAADDLYVRARVESPKVPLCKAPLHPKNACCWTQPYAV